MDKNISELMGFLRSDSEILKHKFQQINSQSYGTPQEISDFRESAFDALISRYFPSPFKLTKGNIRDTYGNKSNSIDTVILSPEHPYTIDQKGKFQLIFAEGVHACIELKPEISKKNELHRALKQIETVKFLTRDISPLLFVGSKSESLIQESLKIPCFIFSMISNKDIDKLIEEIAEYYISEHTPLIRQFDHIIINGKGVISNYKIKEKSYATGNKTCILYEPWGEDTLAAMIMKLSDVIPATPPMQDSIMRRYLKGFKLDAKSYPLINSEIS